MNLFNWNLKKKNQKFFYYSKFLKKFAIIILFNAITNFYSKLNDDIKICLCVITKNENLCVREFVEHYKNIGYNNIFLYDNNEKNGENVKEVINGYIQNGFVKLLYYLNFQKI